MRIAAALSVAALAACRIPDPESPLDRLVPGILESDRIPSAVVVVGTVRGIEYRRAFGAARLDTVFDLASLTKVVGTTTAAMRLVEEGRLSLDDPVGKHLAPFKGRGMTLRDLLTHRTDLPAYLTPRARSPDAILEEIAALKPSRSHRYSCLNMIVLGRVVEQVTGRPLADTLRETVFLPLGMKDTGYDPVPSRCAPTSKDPPGVVHDPLARAYRSPEHCPGNAGLFSTGDDLALFCTALLEGRLLKPFTVTLMFTPDRAPGEATRGLGWDVFDDRPYRPGVGHTGYTGTLLWIDPGRGRFAVVLTNRVYPDDTANVGRLRREILAVVNP